MEIHHPAIKGYPHDELETPNESGELAISTSLSDGLGQILHRDKTQRIRGRSGVPRLRAAEKEALNRSLNKWGFPSLVVS